MAYRNINRAINLAQESKSGNIEYTIAHMNVTKALLLINYVFMGEEEELNKAIEACYLAFVIGEDLCPQLEKEEMKDVKKFLENNWSKGITDEKEIIDKFNELFTRYIRKPNWIPE